MTTAPQAPSVPAPDPGDRRRQRLLSYSTKNMIYSLVAVLALAFGVWAMMPAEDAFERRPVEVDSVAAYAAEQAGHPVWVPVDLPEEWTVTSVRFAGVAGQQTWRMGLVTPSEEFIAISQTVDPAEAWRQALLGDMGQFGELPLEGPTGTATWQLWTGDGETALVLEPSADQRATTVVHGSATEAELAEFVEHLEPAS